MFSSSSFIVLAPVFRYLTVGLIVFCVRMIVWVVGEALLRIFKLQVSSVSISSTLNGAVCFSFFTRRVSVLRSP